MKLVGATSFELSFSWISFSLARFTALCPPAPCCLSFILRSLASCAMRAASGLRGLVQVLPEWPVPPQLSQMYHDGQPPLPVLLRPGFLVTL